VVLLAVLVEERDVVGAGEVLTEEMRGPALQSLPVPHEPLDRQGLLGPREALRLRLSAPENGDREDVLRDLAIDVQHLDGLGPGLFGRRVSGMAFLPQELTRPKEQARSELVTEHVAPLVVEER
jgi:hypothetical protein